MSSTLTLTQHPIIFLPGVIPEHFWVWSNTTSIPFPLKKKIKERKQQGVETKAKEETEPIRTVAVTGPGKQEEQ